MLPETQIIDVLKALADPNRLRLFELLLRSDQTNSELMEQTGLRQNLLSHHLNILCASGLIRTSQSIGDARRHYYSADLRTTRSFGAWWQRHIPPETSALPVLKQSRRVLFLCLHNASRSMIAEALVRHLAPESLIVYSAGIEDMLVSLPPVTLQVLTEHHVSIDGLTAKSFDKLPDIPFDYLISVCDIVHENSIPDNLVYQEYIHWSLRDPVEGIDDQAEQIRLARELYDEIVLRLSYFVQRLAEKETDS
jgi:protein-tyrosine-phosphatase/DNA-binding HxlR family transcriptional regulator